MFRELRRRDRKLDEKSTDNLLKKGIYSVLSTTGKDGYAYGSPLNYVFSNNSIYFHCAKEGHKLDNIKHNNKVCFCVVGDTKLQPQSFSIKYESAIVFGQIEEVREDKKYDALMSLIKKYAGEFYTDEMKQKAEKYIDHNYGKTRVFRIDIENTCGKRKK